MSAAPSLVVFLRHGRSIHQELVGDQKVFTYYWPDAETRDRYPGLTDPVVPLSAAGIEQARTVAPQLMERFGRFDVVVHSGYVRAIETASVVLNEWGVNLLIPAQWPRLVMNPWCRERNYGVAWHMTQAEVATHFPWLVFYRNRESRFLSGLPMGESYADVVTRAHIFQEELRERFSGMRVLVVSHSRFIQATRIEVERPESVYGELPFPTLGNCGWVAYRRTPAGTLELEEVVGNEDAR